MHALLLALSLTAAPPPGGNVILITWDGVRWQDFFDRGPEAPFARFWAHHAPDARVVEKMTTSNPAQLSLPSYQEMMTGARVPCDSNLCGRVGRETLIDRLVQTGLGDQLTVVASWQSIAEAASAHPYPFVDTGHHPGEPRGPWDYARLDRATWAKGLAALERRPRFLWISLNDADEWAHRGSRDSYLSALKRYDAWLDQLLTRLAAMEDYGERTTVLVTTDHGRGDGGDWVDHGHSHPEAARIFALVFGPGAEGQLLEQPTHHAIRPTVEAALGLAPSGEPLVHRVGAAPTVEAAR